MTEIEFWKMLAQSGDATRSIPQQEKKLRKLLSQLTPDEIVSFNDWFGHFVRGAFFYRLWGAAWLIGDGCSDDSFWDFRCWLVAQGEQVYRNALANPDSLADIVNPRVRKTGLSFSNPAMFVWGERLGKDESDLDDFPQAWGSNLGETPPDAPFDEDSRLLRKQYPQLWNVVSG